MVDVGEEEKEGRERWEMEIGWTAVALVVTFTRRHTLWIKKAPRRGSNTTRQRKFELPKATRLRLPSPRRAVGGFASEARYPKHTELESLPACCS